MRLVWFSCDTKGIDFVSGHFIAALNPDVVINQGDIPYVTSGLTALGYTSSTITLAASVNDFKAHHYQERLKSGYAAMRAACKYEYYMPDDHEWGGDDWDHTVAQANDAAGVNLGASTQAEVDAHWWNGIQAVNEIRTEFCDNPVNTDSGATAEKPASADAGTAASQYPVGYFRQGFDVNGDATATSPLVELFQIDCISYRSATADVDDSSKTMLGANQKAWLKAQLLASTATFKIISSTKKTYKAGGDNADTWGDYTTERDEILAYIDSNGITGVLWITGDKHNPHVISTKKSDGDTYDHIDIVACPVNVDVGGLNTASEIKFIGGVKCYGVLDISETRIDATIRGAINNKPIWKGYLSEGDNAISYSANIGI